MSWAILTSNNGFSLRKCFHRRLSVVISRASEPSQHQYERERELSLKGSHIKELMYALATVLGPRKDKKHILWGKADAQETNDVGTIL